jgi:hypothetical protein
MVAIGGKVVGARGVDDDYDRTLEFGCPRLGLCTGRGRYRRNQREGNREPKA